MSKYALLFMALTAGCGFVSLNYGESETLGLAAKVGAGLFGALFFMSMLVGRKIKFDPILR